MRCEPSVWRDTYRDVVLSHAASMAVAIDLYPSLQPKKFMEALYEVQNVMCSHIWHVV
jgi:hypothetical protein